MNKVVELANSDGDSVQVHLHGTVKVCMTPKSWVKFMSLSVYNSLKGICVKINLTLEEASIYNFIITY